MEYNELQILLNSAKDLVNLPAKKINRNAPEVQAVIKTYQKLTGKIVGLGTCINCILDAYFEMKQLTETKLMELQKEKKFKMVRFPIYFGPRHQHYTNANITDEIAIEMVKFNRVLAANFEKPEELLAALSGSSTPKSSTPAESSVVQVTTRLKKKANKEALAGSQPNVSVAEKTVSNPSKKGK